MKKDDIFLNPGKLVDGDLELVLEAKLPADHEKGYMPAYKFAMREPGKDAKIGEIGLKIGTPPNHMGHIWYRVLPDYQGNHYAARSCRLLVPLARQHNINPIWITCREDNTASRRSAEIAGAKLSAIVKTPKGYKDWLGPVSQKCKYFL